MSACAAGGRSYDEIVVLARRVRMEAVSSLRAAGEVRLALPNALYSALEASEAARVLESDTREWTLLPLWAQRARLEKAHLVVD